jgi:dTDP-glucose 4,6-dehydratase/UDP-glucose 4-epimerase
MTASLFKNKKVLLTGGIGFIGSNLAIRLVEMGANVTLVDSLIPEYGGNLFNIESIRGKSTIVNISDVRDPHAMRYLVKDQDYLFNLAGQTSHMDSMHNPFTDLDINAKAQLSILEACRQYNKEIRIVFASTRQLYGKPQYLPVDEKHPIVPVDVNGINKWSGEAYHLLYNNVYNISATVLRLTNTYGPRMRVKDARQTFLGIWIRRLLEGEPIAVFGDGQQIRDYNYVDDVIDAFLLAATNDQCIGKVYNLGSEERVNLKETAEILIDIEKNAKYEIVPFPEDRKKIDIGDYYTDFSLFRNATGWSPKIELKNGLKMAVDYYRKNLTHYI